MSTIFRFRKIIRDFISLFNWNLTMSHVHQAYYNILWFCGYTAIIDILYPPFISWLMMWYEILCHWIIKMSVKVFFCVHVSSFHPFAIKFVQDGHVYIHIMVTYVLDQDDIKGYISFFVVTTSNKDPNITIVLRHSLHSTY